MGNSKHQAAPPMSWAESARGMGDASWRVRQQAVHRLGEQQNEDIIQNVLAVLRNEHRDLARVNAALQILIRTPTDVLNPLLELLKSPDADLRSYVALALGERGEPAAIHDLIAALSDPQPNVRIHATEALGKLRAGEAVDALIAMVESRDFNFAFPALDALMAIGDERVASSIVQLLSDAMLKNAAIEALGALGDEQSAGALLELFDHRDVSPRAILQSLDRIHTRLQTRLGNSTVPQQVAEWATSERKPRLIAAAMTLPVSDIVCAAQVLSWLPDDRIDGALADLLARAPANDHLIELMVAHRRSARELSLRLPGASAELRHAILQVLARMDDRDCVQALLDAIERDDDEENIAHAIDAVARVGDVRLYEVALQRLGHSSAQVRRAAVAALIALRHANTPADLANRFQDPSPFAREAAIQVAAHWDACHELVIEACHDPDERVRRVAIEQIAAYLDPRVLSIFAEATQDERPEIRAAVAVGLAKYPQASDVQAMWSAGLRDQDVWVRYFTIRSLVARNLVEDYRAAITSLAFDDPWPQVRIAAIEAIARTGTNAWEALALLTESSDAEVASAAIQSLALVGHPEAAKLLARLALSEVPTTSLTAIRALARVTPEADRVVSTLGGLAAEWTSPRWKDAVSALSSLRTPAAAWAIVQVLPYPQRRTACVAALASMSAAALPALARGLRSTELDIRRAIVEVLTRIRTPEATGLLETALNDLAPAIVHAASTALSHIRTVDRTTPRVFEG